uniref:ATP synthase peripheral stalk subunit F6, mitochondrial n=1 Tax=Neogobius melanostomus TaxID=47308 RepID=A0A8C6TGZ1_9GOBI
MVDVAPAVDVTEELADTAPEVIEAAAEELPVEPIEASIDPVQKLFLDAIQSYSSQSQTGGGLVDAGPEYEKALSEEVAKLQRLYGGGDLNAFPTFKFSGGSTRGCRI